MYSNNFNYEVNNKNCLSIYIHIPFCIKKCLYCDFISFPGCIDDFELYTNSLIDEILCFDKSSDYIVKSIFIGGGTPSVFPPKFIEKIFDTIKSKFIFDDNIEITIEANPKTLSNEKLNIYRKIGINRLSIGLQAWQNSILESIGRIYTIDDFINSYNMARNAGFDNINIDIMFSLPNQTFDMWKETVMNVVYLNPEHISAYSLIIEPNTPFYELWKNEKLFIPTDEEDRKMYYFLKQYLFDNGYNQYEISNFAKNDFESKHNIVYWTRENYIGFGLNAHSFINNERFYNTSDFKKYISGCIFEDKEKIDYSAQCSEFMFLGLRMTSGVSANNFQRYFGKNIFDVFGSQILWAQKNGLITCCGDNICLTEKGMDLSNVVFREFV